MSTLYDGVRQIGMKCKSTRLLVRYLTFQQGFRDADHCLSITLVTLWLSPHLQSTLKQARSSSNSLRAFRIAFAQLFLYHLVSAFWQSTTITHASQYSNNRAMQGSVNMILLYLLPLMALFAPVCLAALTTWEQIHRTLNLYPLAIDRKDFSLLSSVFTSHAFANYTGPLANLNGLSAISTGLAASVAHVDSQHLLGTTVIDIDSNGKRANSTQYFQASLFGQGDAKGQVVYLYGYYADELRKVQNGKGAVGGEWRIKSRYLIFQGPYIGNTSLLGG